jgi:hypothetical protein
MKFVLQRFSDNRDSTLGLLFEREHDNNGEKLVFKCYTLEDEYRKEKVKGETRIPAGTYTLGLRRQDTPLTMKYRARYYPWFKYHIEILNVPNFVGVYIHIGNYDENTDGCVLLGDGADNNTISPGMINSSTNAFKRFYGVVAEHLEKGSATLEIRDEKHLL